MMDSSHRRVPVGKGRNKTKKLADGDGQAPIPPCSRRWMKHPGTRRSTEPALPGIIQIPASDRITIAGDDAPFASATSRDAAFDVVHIPGVHIPQAILYRDA